MMDVCWEEGLAQVQRPDVSYEQQDPVPEGAGISGRCWFWSFALVAPFWGLVFAIVIWVRA